MSLTLEEDLEDPSGLFVDQARDSLDTSSSSETSDGGLGDALAVRKERERGREEEQKREEGRGTNMLSRKIFLCRLAPPFPSPFPPGEDEREG
jgi:hypothetical protein